MNMILINNIEKILKERGQTIHAFCRDNEEMWGLRNQMYLYQNGTVEPSAKTMLLIAKLLNKKVEEIWELAEDPNEKYTKKIINKKK